MLYEMQKKARLQKKPDKQGLGRLVLYWAAQNNGYVWNEVYFIKKKGVGRGQPITIGMLGMMHLT